MGVRKYPSSVVDAISGTAAQGRAKLVIFPRCAKTLATANVTPFPDVGRVRMFWGTGGRR